MALAETARMIAALEMNDRDFQRGVNNSIRGVAKMQRGFSDLGRGVNRLGTRLAAGVAVGLAGAAKAAIDWEDAFQGVVKTVDEAELAKAGLTFEDLSDSIRQMSLEMPVAATELAGIAEAAGALGIKAGDIESFTRQVAILAATTDVSADDAATALGQLQNVIGLTGAEFDNFAASLVALGNQGASTESQILEIARRAGGAAKLFGIGKDAILGWAAAAANLGINSESAGTSLQNVFLKLMPEVASGSKSVAKLLGMSAANVKKAFKKDASGALENFVQRLAKLPKDARLEKIQQIFGKGSGITRLLLGFTNQVDAVSKALDTSTKSWFESTAAQEEFEKRNATVKSAMLRLKNGIIDAAVSIGEGFTPALGRAADKLAEFLKDPANRSRLKAIGEDIGKAIDRIDWDKALGAAKGIAAALKPALDLVIRIAETIAKLPPEVIGAGGGLLVANKLSGGLIGSGLGGILGGLGESLAKGLASKIPLFGKAFVQPVFVTNMGVGGMGGGIGGVGATGKLGGLMGKLGSLLSVIGIIGSAVAVIEQWMSTNAESSAHATDVAETLDVNIVKMSDQDLQTAMNGVRQGIKDLDNPLMMLARGNSLETLKSMEAKLQAIIDQRTVTSHAQSEHDSAWTPAGNRIPTTPAGSGQLVARNIERMKERLEQLVAAGKTGQANEVRDRLNTANQRLQELRGDMVAAVKENGTTVGSGLSTLDTSTVAGFAGTNTNVRGTTTAVNSASAAIAGAIAAKDLSVTVTVPVHVSPVSIEKNTTIIKRYGQTTGSYGGGTGGGGQSKLG